MKAITLWQPWASLVAVGAKTIETRGWPAPASLIGQPLLIHAAKRKPDVGTAPLDVLLAWHDHDAQIRPLPLGAVVASCRLAACVPMVGIEDRRPDEGGWLRVGHRELGLNRGGEHDEMEFVTAERPFGHYERGRHAWLLEDVKPTTERCPRCWGDGGSDWGDLSPGGDYGPQGYTPLGFDCPTCRDCGVCPPVPMKGRQRVWTVRDEEWWEGAA